MVTSGREPRGRRFCGQECGFERLRVDAAVLRLPHWAMVVTRAPSTVPLLFLSGAWLACGARSELEIAERNSGGANSTGGQALGGGGQAPGGGGQTSGGGGQTQGGQSQGGSNVGGGNVGGGATINGCADGTREGFVDAASFPNIAGCSGGFAIPGLLSELVATCDRQAGDDSENPVGAGCSAEDLCAEGFTVCKTASSVETCGGSCEAATAEPGLFFVTRQSGTGCGVCAIGTSVDQPCLQCSCAGGCLQTDITANDIFGCGTAGLPTAGCGAITRFSDDGCGALGAPWICNGGSCTEATTVIKSGPDGGGVLCCREDC